MGPLGVLLGDPLFGHGTWKGCSLGRWGKGQGSVTPGGGGRTGQDTQDTSSLAILGVGATASKLHCFRVDSQTQEAAGGARLQAWTLPPARALDKWSFPGIGGWEGRTSPHPTALPQGPTIKVTHPASLAQPPSCITTSRCSSGLCPITGSADLPQLLRGFLPPTIYPRLSTPDYAPGCLAWEGRILPHPVYLPAWNQARGQAPAQRWS